MLPIHPIKYDRNGQNARRRAKSGTSHKRQRSDGTNLVMCFNQNDFFIWNIATLRPYIMGSELRCQNFDLVKFREIIPRNPSYGTFFSQNLSQNSRKILIRRLSPNLSQNFGQILTRALGLTTWSELHLEVVAPRFEEIYKGGIEGNSRP